MVPPLSGVRLEFAPSDGSRAVTSLSQANPDEVASGQPVRSFASYAGMRHYPGWWWSATTGDHVPYESLLERERIMLADFDTGITHIAAQPFGITGSLNGVDRRHVPDFLLRGPNEVLVVDVKPARMLDRPEVADVLEWTTALMAERGWRYEVWSGASATTLENVRFLAQGRRPLVDDAALATLRRTGQTGDSLAKALATAVASEPSLSIESARAAMVRLLWRQEWRVDLATPVNGASRITRTGAPA